MDNKTYSLCEAVFDLAQYWHGMPDEKRPEDSREMAQLTIEWAAEFDEMFETWETENYFDCIESWFNTKHAEWLRTTDARMITDDPCSRMLKYLATHNDSGELL